jgi:hypothetical protein
LDSVIAAYSITDSTDFNTKVPVFLDPSYTGYKLGAGAGTTLGQAAQKVYAISSSADVTQTTAASQPLLLAHSGVNYWWGSGVDGNGLLTPHSAANNIIGDFSIVINCYIDNLVLGITTIYAKWGSPNQLGIDIQANGSIKINYQTNDSVARSVQTSTGVAIVGLNNITITRNVTTGKWFCNGVDLGGVALPLISSTNDVTISGFNTTFTGQQFRGKITRITVWNNDSQTGAPVVDFNPATYNASTSQTDWTSATGEVWTINTGTAATGYKGCVVSKTIVQSDGVDDELRSGTISITQGTRYSAMNPFVLTTGYMIGGSNAGVGDKQITFLLGAQLRETSGGGSINYTGFVASKLQIAQATYNGASSQVTINNSNNVTGTLTTDTFDKFIIFNNVANVPKNMTLNTLIAASFVNDITQRTALYNIIRSMNNNAF